MRGRVTGQSGVVAVLILWGVSCSSPPEECETWTWFPDLDGDGYGDATSPTTGGAASPPPGYVASGGDCNDANASIYPGAEERCDHLDSSCSGSLDDEPYAGWYYDGDGDGVGSILAPLCPEDAPSDEIVAVSGDCDDEDSALFPGNDERCDGKDNDCNGSFPEDGASSELDADEDSVRICAGDCDDSAATIYPGAEELCDYFDSDCVPDNEPYYIYYRDVDEDGYASDGAESSGSCSAIAPLGWADELGDCNDLASTVYPGAEESPYNDRDDDCDGEIDETRP